MFNRKFERLQNQFGTAALERAIPDHVESLNQRGFDGIPIGYKRKFAERFHIARQVFVDARMEIADRFCTESGRATAMSVGLDMRADWDNDMRLGQKRPPLRKFFSVVMNLKGLSFSLPAKI